MEKALDTPSNVMIYKQHWDYYAKTPGLLDKLKTDQPVQHHLLQHFRQNFWHLVENLEKLKADPEPQQQQQQQQIENQHQQQQQHHAGYGGQEQTSDYLRPSSGMDSLRDSASFGRQFGADESSIQREMESYQHDPSMMTPSPVLPERLTPLMFSRPHVCARMSASGLLVKVEPNNPRVSVRESTNCFMFAFDIFYDDVL